MLSRHFLYIEQFDAVDNGVIAGISEGKIIVDCATLSPERMIAIAAQVNSRGGHFLEAPVSGSKVPAETGQLIFLCGGDANIFEEVGPALDVMGKAKFLFGPVGKGSQVKLVVNMIMGSMMTAFGEGLALGKALDMPLDSLLQVLDLGAMSNPMFRGKGPAMVQEKFPTNFPLKHQQKDMRLALELASQYDLPLPTASAANDLYKKAINEQQRGDEDFSAVLKAVTK
jgi:3-hydroxyisobutyrate dehydrogenase-like beta-hydroxyacid dehydrogenase